MTFVDTANQYIDDVLAGRIVACKWVKLACERQRRDLARAEMGDPDFPYRFDNDAATRICEFIELLPHTKGRWARTRQPGDDVDGQQRGRDDVAIQRAQASDQGAAGKQDRRAGCDVSGARSGNDGR
ncbi:hypothetical protein [Burkholderia vietnamiensis]|uniref:hypothetical protein n=1 Tax=Burkholderia vietnamiensis TaxID=60552 RepID=UPI0018C89F08|nr:hypothetical protein [Burkholderia vietnamiensis]